MKSGWVIKKLGEVCEIKLGKTPPRDDYSFWDRQKSSGYVWVSISDMASLTDGRIIDSKEYITNKAIEEAGVPIVKKGTLLLSFKLTIGRTAIAGRDLSTNEAIAALPLKQEFAQLIDLHYLVFYFAAFDWYLFAAKDDKMLGKTLNKKRLATVPVLIPPLPAQKRIVAKIDAAFEKIDKLKANAEKNLANAKDLFQSALDEAMRPKKGWVEKRLPDICINYDSKRIPITKNRRKAGSVPYYGASGIVDYVEGYIFEGEYLLISEDGANLESRTYPIAFSISGRSWVNNHAHILKFADRVTQSYVELYVNSISLKDYITGAAQPKLTQENLNKIPIYVPPLSEQREIVNRLDLLAEKIKTIEQNYNRQIAGCVEMRQAVLREAFEGRL